MTILLFQIHFLFILGSDYKFQGLYSLKSNYWNDVLWCKIWKYFYKNYSSLVEIAKHVTQCHDAVLDVLAGMSVGWAL